MLREVLSFLSFIVFRAGEMSGSQLAGGILVESRLCRSSLVDASRFLD